MAGECANFWQTMLSVGTSVGLFIGGFATGFFSRFLSDWLTDRRRAKKGRQEEQEIFRRVAADTPDAIEELRAGLKRDRVARDFYVVPSEEEASLEPGSWIIDESKHKHPILKQFELLENVKYIENIRPPHATKPHWKMTKVFVKLLMG